MQLHNAKLNKRIYVSHTPFFLSDNRLEEQIVGDPSFEHVKAFSLDKIRDLILAVCLLL